MNEIARPRYLKSLIESRENGMIKIITGVRRCGKSYLLFRLFKNYLMSTGVTKSHIIEIALDGIENEHLREAHACYDFIKGKIADEGVHYVLIDEVQFLPHFEEVLNSLLRISNVDVYVTGSNSKFLSSDIVTEFRGRGDEVRIYPLSFSEYFTTTDKDFDDAFDEYVTYGGLPMVLAFQSEKKKSDYLRNVFENVYLKDVIDRNSIQNREEIGLLVDVLASAIGAPTNPTKIENTFATNMHRSYSSKTIANHIVFLQEAFLISKALRYDIKGRKYIGSGSKYYFVDVGLRNVRLTFRQQEITHIMENVVYNELVARGYQVDVGEIDVVEKDKTGKSIRKKLEVDFVVNRGNARYYIQVALNLSRQEKEDQEFNSLRRISDGFKKIVIIGGSQKPFRNDEGFLIMGLKNFLLNDDSLEFDS